MYISEITIVLFLALASAVGLAIIDELKRRRECTDLHGELRQLSQQVAKLTREIEETKTINDSDRSIGQNLSCLIIQLDVARRMRAKNPDKSIAALEEARHLADQSLDEVRRRCKNQTKDYLKIADLCGSIKN